MSDESKSGTPRWILIATGCVGLVAAVLVAATKYYDLHKARAEALKPGVSLEAPAAQPEKLGTEPNPMATAQPSKIEPKANGKAAGGWEKVTVLADKPSALSIFE